MLVDAGLNLLVLVTSKVSFKVLRHARPTVKCKIFSNLVHARTSMTSSKAYWYLELIDLYRPPGLDCFYFDSEALQRHQRVSFTAGLLVISVWGSKSTYTVPRATCSGVIFPP